MILLPDSLGNCSAVVSFHPFSLYLQRAVLITNQWGASKSVQERRILHRYWSIPIYSDYIGYCVNKPPPQAPIFQYFRHCCYHYRRCGRAIRFIACRFDGRPFRWVWWKLVVKIFVKKITLVKRLIRVLKIFLYDFSLLQNVRLQAEMPTKISKVWHLSEIMKLIIDNFRLVCSSLVYYWMKTWR